MDSSIDERMAIQSAEFDAIEKLAEAWRALTKTPIVDDDYPRMRRRYEREVEGFLQACKANGRAA